MKIGDSIVVNGPLKTTSVYRENDLLFERNIQIISHSAFWNELY